MSVLILLMKESSERTPPTVSFKGRKNDFERSADEWEREMKMVVQTLEVPAGIPQKKLLSLRAKLKDLLQDPPSTARAQALVKRAAALP